MGESERQQLTAEAYRAARELTQKEIMAAIKNAGVSQDILEKSQPLALKVVPASLLHLGRCPTCLPTDLSPGH